MPLLLCARTVVPCVHQGENVIWEHEVMEARAFDHPVTSLRLNMWFCLQTNKWEKNLIMKDSNAFWAESGEGSCPSSLLLLGAHHQKQSRLIRHQATTKVTNAISPSLSDEHCWFCSDLKDAIGNLWDLPLASSLLANFTRRLRN